MIFCLKHGVIEPVLCGCGEMVYTRALGARGATRESSSLSTRTMLWIALILLIVTATFSYGSLSAAPWVPMFRKDVQRIVAVLHGLPTGSVIYELGCGDARVSAALAQVGYRVTGFEISLLPFALAVVRRLRSIKKFSLQYRNFWSKNFEDANAIVLFLMPNALKKIREKCNQELHPGTYVVSYVWPIPGWTPKIIDKVPGSPDIFVYVTS